MDKGRLRALKEKARGLEPVVRIGKNGLTETTVEQVSKVLAARQLVKVKFLHAFIESNDRKKAASELAKATASQLIDQVGFIAVLYKSGTSGKAMRKTPNTRNKVRRKTLPKRSQLRR